MKVRTVKSITTPKGEIPPGTIIDIPVELAEKLWGKVTHATDGKELATYCPDSPDGAWCSCRIGLGTCQHCGEKNEKGA